jgi:uncharacterized membrane protein
MISEATPKKKKNFPLIALISAAIVLTWQFIGMSTTGCYGKISSIGSSVCHQIPSHSFISGNLQFPVCARCAGLYLGSFIGILFGFISGKRIAVPNKKILVFLIFLFLLWAADGLNSLINDLLYKIVFYETTNTTRLITGYGMGMVMSTALVTLFNYTVWEKGIKVPVLDNMKQIIGYALLTAVSSRIFFSRNIFLFQAAAYITIFTVLSIISLLYAIFWVIILKKENQFSRWGDFTLYLIAGYITAILQVIILISLRNKIFF